MPKHRFTRAPVVLSVAAAIAGITGAVQAAIPDGKGVIHACYDAKAAGRKDGTPLSIIDSGTTTCAKTATEVTWNRTGPPGTTGARGESIHTSAGDPTGGCTSGDVDVDLANGEVYNCTSSAWVDSGSTLRGANGINVTSSALGSGDSHCLYGGSSFASASGTTYACNGAPGAKGDTGPPGSSDQQDATWTGSTDSSGNAETSTQFAAGDIVTELSATVSGDLTACPGFGVELSIARQSGSQYLAVWNGLGDVLSSAAPNVQLGNSSVSDGTSGLEIHVDCLAGPFDPVEPVPPVDFTVTIRWQHFPSTTIN